MGFNFRDVGPLEGDTGVWLKAGLLFRSGCPGKTSAADFVGIIGAHGIRSIVDLRCPDERTESSEYFEPLGAVAVVPVPFLETIEDRWVNPRSTDAVSTAQRYLEMIESSRQALPRIFGWLAEPEHVPVLVHCAAGRDRTGMVCALLLAALGADRGQIAADYARSQGQVDDGYAASASTIAELFVLIDRKYGGLVALLDHLGVADLRSALGEPCR